MRPPRIPPPEGHLELLDAGRAPYLEAVSPTLPDGRYLHWDELRHREPPEGLSSEQWWGMMRHRRRLAPRSKGRPRSGRPQTKRDG